MNREIAGLIWARKVGYMLLYIAVAVAIIPLVIVFGVKHYELAWTFRLLWILAGPGIAMLVVYYLGRLLGFSPAPDAK
jgi:hypothetical protein